MPPPHVSRSLKINKSVPPHASRSLKIHILSGNRGPGEGVVLRVIMSLIFIIVLKNGPTWTVKVTCYLPLPKKRTGIDRPFSSLLADRVPCSVLISRWWPCESSCLRITYVQGDIQRDGQHCTLGHFQTDVFNVTLVLFVLFSYMWAIHTLAARKAIALFFRQANC